MRSKKPNNFFPSVFHFLLPLTKQSSEQTSTMAPIFSKKRKHSLKELKTLGQQLLSSRAHINNLPLLLTFVSPTSPPQFLLESLLSLQSFFTPVLPHLPPSASSSSKTISEDSRKNDPEFIYKTWLRSKFDELVRLLVDVLISPASEDALRVSSFVSKVVKVLILVSEVKNLGINIQCLYFCY